MMDTVVKIDHIDFVVVHTKDFDKAKAFYTDTLGLDFAKTYGKMPGGEIDVGNLTLQIFDPSFMKHDFRPSQAIALRVDDVEKTRKVLEAKGVEFHGDTIDSGVCHMAFFSDLDGNPFILHHRYAPVDARPHEVE